MTAAEVTFTGEVHPVADLFPMLPDDELGELAEDIKTNGLLQPLVLDDEGRLLDGRNRLAACRLAGVDPVFQVYDGGDPNAYALSVNIARRHLTKGQQAMVVAQAGALSQSSLRAVERETGISNSRLSFARTVLAHAPDLAHAVVAGASSLDQAYETARSRKRAAESTETQMAVLRDTAPDLADLVVEERMTLAEAVAAARQREAELRREQDAAIRDVRDGLATFVAGVVSLVGTVPAENWPVTEADLDRADEALSLLRKDLP